MKYKLIMLIILIIGFGAGHTYGNYDCYKKIQMIGAEEINPLTEILNYEISNAKKYFEIKNITPVCLDYALYYNESLQKYKGMDIRFPRWIDICNEGVHCEGLHTYILVNSHHSNCILDQKRYTCLFGKINHTGDLK